MRVLARVLFDEAHRQAWSIVPDVAARMNPTNPADAGYVRAAGLLRESGFAVARHVEGAIDDAALAGVDVLVLPHCSTDEYESTTGVGSPRYTAAELEAIELHVRSGGGLIVLAETEQSKYGNSFADLAARFGITIVSATVQDSRRRFRDVPTWVLGEPVGHPRYDLAIGGDRACFYRSGVLAIDEQAPDAFAVFRASGTASLPGVPLLVAAPAGAGRVVVSADSDLFGDDSIDDLDHRTLWVNLVTWAAVTRHVGAGAAAAPLQDGSASVGWSVSDDPGWHRLVAAIEALRPLQNKDGSVSEEHRPAGSACVDEIVTAVEQLAPRFPHQADQLPATVRDFRTWQAQRLGVPDFLDSLLLFHPERDRTDAILHLAVFPMMTQNGNPNRNVEAVVTRTVWPGWIAELESKGYDNPAFVPIEFVAFTAGYDTHSAVLFPETVAMREVPRFTWGGIFCDREAARFRRVSREAASCLRLALPPDAEMLLADQDLAKQTYVLWDLVHDRTHSHGDLPFDPFMIKQRMPYWMYGLEELRCDLNTYRETPKLAADGVVLARHVRLAILFDRLFRFPTTGPRVRNYDGLGGQILFAWLHRNGAVAWTDNTLRFDWGDVDGAVVGLCEAIETLYRDGIDRSRLGHWAACHAFVNGLVPAHPASVWAAGPQGLPAEPKAAVDAVLPDEFPLSLFYEALRKKLAATIDSTSGITGADA